MTQNGIKDIEDVTAETLKTQKGFDSFFRTNYAMFVSFARKYCLSTEEAQDIVQDVLTAFWQQRNDFESVIAAKAFCYRAISNHCLNFLKHEDIKNRYAENQMLKMQSEEFIQANIIRQEVACLVRRKINTLSAREREIVLMALRDMSNKEIAEKLSISVATVKTHKMHAYAQLRAQLDELRFLLFIL